MRRRCRRSGQSTLEYLIVLCAIVAAVMIARAVVQERVQWSIGRAGEAVFEQTENLLGQSSGQ